MSFSNYNNVCIHIITISNFQKYTNILFKKQTDNFITIYSL